MDSDDDDSINGIDDCDDGNENDDMVTSTDDSFKTFSTTAGCRYATII